MAFPEFDRNQREYNNFLTDRDGEVAKRVLNKEDEYYLAMAKGSITGHSFETTLGVARNLSMGILATIWPENNKYIWPTGALTMTVSAANTGDTSAGIGLRTLRIHGLDESFNQITEDIILDGQTGVTTTNSYYRINSLEGLTAGSTGSNEGRIYIGTGIITTGKPAVVYNLIDTVDGEGFNISSSGFYTVPIGKELFIKDLFFSVQSGKNCEFMLTHRHDGEIFKMISSLDITQNIVNLDGALHDDFPIGCDIEYQAVPDQNTTRAKLFSKYILVDV